jgi:hypothetical protein
MSIQYNYLNHLIFLFPTITYGEIYGYGAAHPHSLGVGVYGTDIWQPIWVYGSISMRLVVHPYPCRLDQV